MTAQTLITTSSSSTDSFKAFKQAFQNKPNPEPYRRDNEAVSIPQHQQQEQRELQSTEVLRAARPKAWGVANTVETDSQSDQGREEHQRQQQQQQQPERRQRAMVVSDIETDASLPAAAGVDEAAAGGGGNRAAIPMSPPSSPTHVAVAPVQEQVAAAPATAATPMEAEVPPVPSPAPAIPAVTASVAAVRAPISADTPAAAAPAPAPVRLGRGRKLCPNCKALTKSAVKQCRACKHVFSPASARLRAQSREPKENEEVPVLPRRRTRPSQRLLESLVESAQPPPSSAAPARRPLAASSSGGGANQHVDPGAGGGGGRPVVGDGVAIKMACSGSGGGGGGGSVRQKQEHEQQQQPPKRSHKRKVPLPPGVAPPRRKKGAAAAARLAAAGAASNAAGTEAIQAANPNPSAAPLIPTNPHGILPLLSLPERQRLAKDLASPTPSRHQVLVPESPDLAPMASPAGPLLFMASSASSSNGSSCLEDDSAWLSRSGVGGGGVGGCVVPLPASACPEQLLQQRQQQQQQQQYFSDGGATADLTGLLLGNDDDDEQRSKQQQQQQVLSALRKQESSGGIDLDLSAESQDRDPFADVEMWWEGGGVAGVATPSAGAATGCPPGGRDGTAVEQRVVFPQNTELLGDADDALMWNPLRASSVGGTNSGAGGSTAVPPAAAAPAVTVAGRSQPFWARGCANSSDNSSHSHNHHQLLPLQQPSLSCARSNQSSPSAEESSAVFPNFERGAAIASVGTAAVSAGGFAAGRSSTAAPEYLLAEASCSSLPEPLVFGRGGVSGSGIGSGAAAAAAAAVAAVSMDSGDIVEGGGFWNPLLRSSHSEAEEEQKEEWELTRNQSSEVLP
ncbi:unnamed protein product [Pylaiella littoralis]